MIDLSQSRAESPVRAHDLSEHFVTYLGHATILIEIDGLRILTDPLLRRRTALLRRPKITDPDLYVEDIDAVVVSHMHWDHLDVPSLKKLPPETPVFAPAGAREVLLRAGLQDIRTVSPGDREALGEIVVETTPANHDGFRPPFGPDGEAVGFVFHGSRSVYFAGDTDLFDDMASIGSKLDLALLPIWGWGPTLGTGHLDPVTAAAALNLLEPNYAVPIHWGTLCPIGLKWTRPEFLTRPPREFARQARRRAPDVDVRVVQPGGRLELVPTAS